MAIREELQRREDALNQLEKDLNEKSRLLEARSQRVEELESLSGPRTRSGGLACPFVRGPAGLPGQGAQRGAAQWQSVRPHGGQTLVLLWQCGVDVEGRPP